MTLGEQRLAIEHNANMIAERASKEMGVPCAFDRAAVAWLERHIEWLRADVAADWGPEVDLTFFFTTYYPFFGECFVRTYGGQWVFVNGENWGVHLDGTALTIFPQRKIVGLLTAEEGESPLDFFLSIGWEHRGDASCRLAAIERAGAGQFSPRLA